MTKTRAQKLQDAAITDLAPGQEQPAVVHVNPDQPAVIFVDLKRIPMHQWKLADRNVFSMAVQGCVYYANPDGTIDLPDNRAFDKLIGSELLPIESGG